MKKLPELTLSATESAAILAALPLIPCLDFDTPAQQLAFNSALAESAAAKLAERHTVFSLNEIRVMFVAVNAANLVLTGVLSLDDPELRSQISPHFFVYGSLLKRKDFQIKL